jgi:hypothetical protein
MAVASLLNVDAPFLGAFVAGSTDDVQTILPIDAAGTAVEVNGICVAVAAGPAVGVGVAALPPQPMSRIEQAIAAATTRASAGKTHLLPAIALARNLLTVSNCTVHDATREPLLTTRSQTRTIGDSRHGLSVRTP